MTELDRLMNIPPAPESVRRLMTTEGFIASYEALTRCCKTYQSAYEVLEIQHERVFGCRKYDNYFSFKSVYWRKQTKRNGRAK
jgi:hypothetical protein